VLPAEGPVFGEPTNVLLLLDDGIDGLTAVDLDRRLAGRSVVEGQRAGDETHSMIRVGDKLVVGWAEPHAVDILTRQAVSLGDATVFVPAAETNRVWMVDSGSSIGQRQTEVWQVDVATGQALQEPIPLETEGGPEIGILNGLALQTEEGMSLWDMQSDEVTALEADGPGFAQDSHGDQLVWCSGDCTALSLTNTSLQDTEHLDLPAPYETVVGRSQISADGRYVASLLGEVGEGVGKAIWIVDPQTGASYLVYDPDTSVDFLAWSPDGDQLFATSYSYGGSSTVTWRYQVSDQEFSAVVLPFGGAMTPVAIDNSVADAYITDETAEASECRAPMLQPSGRTEICSFGF
jgi:WD40 repeat protein